MREVAEEARLGLTQPQVAGPSLAVRSGAHGTCAQPRTCPAPDPLPRAGVAGNPTVEPLKTLKKRHLKLPISLWDTSPTPEPGAPSAHGRLSRTRHHRPPPRPTDLRPPRGPGLRGRLRLCSAPGAGPRGGSLQPHTQMPRTFSACALS